MTAKKSASKPATAKKAAKRAPAAKRPDLWEVTSRVLAAVEHISKGKAHRDRVDDWEKALDEYECFLESRTLTAALKHLRAALAADPAHIDALASLADEADLDLNTNLAVRILIVKAARLDLGKDFFKEYEGHFWSFLETRPFMRAKAALAQAHFDMPNPIMTLAEYMDMLRLNPGDNQGVRYQALPLTILLRRREETSALLETYPGEDAAVFAWCRLALIFTDREPDLEMASAQLAEARASNPHVEDLLLSERPEPLPKPSFYSPGSIEEACCFIDEIALAFISVPPVMEWLHAQNSGKAGAIQPSGTSPKP